MSNPVVIGVILKFPTGYWGQLHVILNHTNSDKKHLKIQQN